MNKQQLIYPNWNAPDNVQAFTTTRNIGFSQPPYHKYNLATHVGDKLCHVKRNRQLLREMLPSDPHWLVQQHTNHAINLDAPYQKEAASDASYTKKANTVCAVLTADCLPILLTNTAGTIAVAIHAGWKGLFNGIISHTIQQLDLKEQTLIAWIGPAISQRHYQVSNELFLQFANKSSIYCSAFKEESDSHYLLSLQELASIELQTNNIRNISISNHCTFEESDLFFSYRREGVTGRIASLIWLS